MQRGQPFREKRFFQADPKSSRPTVTKRRRRCSGLGCLPVLRDEPCRLELARNLCRARKLFACLEPFFLVVDVDALEFRLGLREVDDAFDDGDDPHHSCGNANREQTADERDAQHDDARLVVA